MGGEIGDVGSVTLNGKCAGTVVNTTKTGDGYFLHEFVANEEVKVGDTVTLCVDKKIRASVQRNHSATHILQQALKDVLGDHVAQAGSYVNDSALRFDFSHFAAMTSDELKKVEEIVNEKIMDAIAVSKEEMAIEEAKKTGAKALFGEKYGDVVRVVSMGDYSIEFCGGCHVDNTAQIGLFKILSESGVAAGIRRIQAITGAGVLEYIAQKDNLISRTAEALKSNPSEIDLKAQATVSDMKEMQKTMREKVAKSQTDALTNNAKTIKGVKVITANMGDGGMDELRVAGDQLKDKISDAAVIVLANGAGEKFNFVSIANKEAVAKGAHAGLIMKEVTKIAGGSGGGKPDSARGGGKDAAKIDEALASVEALVSAQVSE